MALIIRVRGGPKDLFYPIILESAFPIQKGHFTWEYSPNISVISGSFGVFIVMTSNGRGDKILDTVENYMECLSL